jgi:zinc transporter
MTRDLVDHGERLWSERLQPDYYGSPVWEHWQWPIDEGESFAEELGIDETVAEALTIGLARPRVSLMGPGSLLVVLRGVNLNPGAEPDDMVSIRIWATRERVLSVEARRVFAARDVQAEVTSDRESPRDSAHLVVAIAEALIERIRPVIDELEDRVASLEEDVLDDRSDQAITREISAVRRSTVALRRHLAPQRDALLRLRQDLQGLGGLSPDGEASLREVIDRAQRYVEEIEETRERAIVLGEEIDRRTGQRINRLTYMFSLVAVVFLPLGFLTGLLGINVGGIPFAENTFGFWIVFGVLTALVVGELVLLRRLRVF